MPQIGINSEIKFYNSGVHNFLPDTVTPADSASDALGWVTQDGRLKLVGGRVPVGAEGLTGMITGEIFGYKADGTTVHWRKSGTKIQYFDGTTWQDTITGLTASDDYAFANYSSLAGNYTFAIGVDGIFKMNNANPGSYIALYDAAKNFKGRAMIDRSRMILWNRAEDKTGLYGSHIDAQNNTVYTSVAAESVGSSGSTNYTGSLAFKAANPLANSFGIQIYGAYGSSKTVSAITKAASAQITANGHGYVVGNTLIITGVVGMTEINNLLLTVTQVVDVNNFKVNVNSTGFTSYSSAGATFKAEVFRDAYLGNLVGSQGGSGTINYVTGAYNITFNVATTSAVFANYQWENSNVKGITDFTFSSTRLAGEGFQFPQDEGGDPILNVLIGQDGAYYSAKKNSFYVLVLGADDLATGTSNTVYRKQLGIDSWRGVLSTQIGIIFMNTANPEKPELTILQKNTFDNIEPRVLFPHFKFANYDYTDLCMETYDRYIVLACKQQGSGFNDRLLLCNVSADTVDIEPYQARTLAKDAGNLYGGSPVAFTVYNLFNGFDDDGLVVDNFWTSKGELFQPGGPGQARTRRFVPSFLKKHRKLRLRGLIAGDQSYAVFCNYDDSGDQLIGTVLGTGSYVDKTAPQVVGGPIVGGAQVGGGDFVDAFPYFVELRIKKPPKFMKRKLKFVALGFGYIDIEYQNDWGLQFYEDKIPARFRQKQNVSLDGTQTDLPTPEF